MRDVAGVRIKKETISLPLVFILLFYSGTIIALHIVFPVLRVLKPQTLFASMAILLTILQLFSGNVTLKFERIQITYISYCLIATIGLYRAAEVGLLANGQELIANIWKHLALLMILVAYVRTLPEITFVRRWIFVTVALFVLHSMKAILAGYSGLGGRFDNYVGLISNSDYVGIFLAAFVVIFLHIAMQTGKKFSRLVWFVLGIFSLIIVVKTQTRAAALVLGILTPYWIIITSPSKTEIFKKGIMILFVIGALFIIGSMSSSQIGSYFDRISTISRYGSKDADFNIRSRFFMWEQGINIGLTHPLLGVGSGATAPYLDLEFEGVELKDKGSNIEGFSIHNTFIQIFAECGLAGLVLFCLMLLFAYRNFNAVARFAKGQSGRQQLAILADVGRLYFVGYIVGAMFNSIEYDWTLFAFVALAISSRQYIQKTELKRSI